MIIHKHIYYVHFHNVPLQYWAPGGRVAQVRKLAWGFIDSEGSHRERRPQTYPIFRETAFVAICVLFQGLYFHPFMVIQIFLPHS